MDRASNPFGGSQKDHQDFVDRFRQGPQAVTNQEAAARYQQVAPQLPPDAYQQSAQDVFAQLTPEQRMQTGQQLIQQARQQGQSFPDVNGDGIDDRLQDPSFLAQKTIQVHQQQPGLLGQLLGGGAPAGGGASSGSAGGMLGSPLAKGIMGGIAGTGLMRMLGAEEATTTAASSAPPTWPATSAVAPPSVEVTGAVSARSTRKPTRTSGAVTRNKTTPKDAGTGRPRPVPIIDEVTTKRERKFLCF